MSFLFIRRVEKSGTDNKTSMYVKKTLLLVEDSTIDSFKLGIGTLYI